MQRAITAEEFLALPEAKPGFEFFDGRVIQKAVTNADHIRIVWRLSAAFHDYAASHGGAGGPEGSVAFDSGKVEPDVLLPDFAFWAAGVDMGVYPLAPPTIAIEVRSPSQTMASQREKCEFYIDHGVREAWLIDPEGQTVDVFGADGFVEQLEAIGTLRSRALPDFELHLVTVFG